MTKLLTNHTPSHIPFSVGLLEQCNQGCQLSSKPAFEILHFIRIKQNNWQPLEFMWCRMKAGIYGKVAIWLCHWQTIRKTGIITCLYLHCQKNKSNFSTKHQLVLTKNLILQSASRPEFMGISNPICLTGKYERGTATYSFTLTAYVRISCLANLLRR